VTRKICRSAAAIKLGLEKELMLGDTTAKRDWGHARDYVRGMWLMLQQAAPDDYVLATGRTTSVRRFTEMAFAEAGITIEWRGSGKDETAVDTATGEVLVEIDPRYFRPTEVDRLVGDATKAREKLGWVPERSVEDLVREMVRGDIKVLEGQARRH
jgi:GDPmannose 4,6-dehydratase